MRKIIMTGTIEPLAHIDKRVYVCFEPVMVNSCEPPL